MVLSAAFEQALEQEIEARVHERITKVLAIISKNYKITYARLLSDLATIEKDSSPQNGGCCCGVTKSGKRCQRPGKYDGYCKNHISQKPDIRVTRSSSSPTPKVAHTHTLPPLFMKGCPACESNKCSKSLRI
jgi:hypothetical protein